MFKEKVCLFLYENANACVWTLNQIFILHIIYCFLLLLFIYLFVILTKAQHFC